MQGLVPNLVIMALQGKWHWLLSEAPEKVNANALAFLGTVRGGGLVGGSIVPVKS
jgi:hypothetical protein